MEEKENIQGEHKSKVGNFWVWSIPVAVLIYVLSPGPVIFILIKIKCNSSWVEKAFDIFYFPLGIIIKHDVPVLKNLLEAYIFFWLHLAGVDI
jgi:hypothetical protein